MTPKFEVGEKVRIHDGLSKGRHGVVLSVDEIAPLGVRMYTVDVIGHRVRTVREDYMTADTTQ
jgi:ribosomal protein L24